MNVATKTNKTKKKKKRKRPDDRDGATFATTLWSGGGGQHGLRERQLDAALLAVELDLAPRWSAGDLELGAPIDVAHRETIGAALRETSARGALAARYRFARELGVSAALGVGAVSRPDWPDLYQPAGDGLLRTDRYSHWDRRAELGLTVHPGRHHWVRGSYEYALADYATDPAFDPVARPNHLTPFDHEQHSAELGYRFSTRTLQIGASVAGFVESYFFVFSRDAHTGSTHAGPNGPPPNPLLELRGLTPAVELEVEPAGTRFELELRYAHELQDDAFAGYASYSGPNPSLTLRWSPWRPLEMRAGLELRWRRYGAGSYRAGPGHPALDSGDRRDDRRVRTSLGAELALTRTLALTLDAQITVRETNFPDYVPGQFPSSQRYAIDWDYTNLLITLGLQWRQHWL